MDSVITLIASLSALAAVVLGPFVAWRIGVLQIKTATHSANRQQWINTLRDEISLYVSLMSMKGMKTCEIALKVAAGEKVTEDGSELFQKVVQSESRIKLLLNPNEVDHARLAELLSHASHLANDYELVHEKYPEQIETLRTEIVVASQAILKREWERVKKLK